MDSFALRKFCYAVSVNIYDFSRILYERRILAHYAYAVSVSEESVFPKFYRSV